jgi:hypothetical protein
MNIFSFDDADLAVSHHAMEKELTLKAAALQLGFIAEVEI